MRARPLVASLVSAAFLFPLVFLVLGSLRAPGAAPPTGLEVLVPAAETSSFERAFDLVPLWRELLNSALVCLIAVPLTVLVASWAGFAAVLLGGRVRRLLVAASLLALLVPVSALWVPRFVLFSQMHLVDTYVPLVAPALMATSPLYVLLYLWSYTRLPRDLLEAGRLAGFGSFTLWRRVGAPLVRPTTFAVGALAFVFHWSNFVDPLLYLNDPALATAPLGLRQLADLGRTDFPVLLAGALVVTFPVVVVFLAVQRRFLSDTRAAGWLAR